MADRPTFDLIDAPWLPCIGRDGQRVEMGLRAALRDAHDLRELFDPSPLVTVALHRLVLAVLHRAHEGPADFDAWEALWRGERWDAAVVDRYLDRWRDRFDLFNPERPFYGVPSMDEARMLPVTLLAVEAASGNNATLFDHSRNADPTPVPAAEAARRLVARQAFAFGGGVSQPFNLSDAPLVRDYTVLAFGETLFETLALNLLPYSWEAPIHWLGDDDLPVWEQPTPRTPERDGTVPLGYADYLTWQSRRIHLVPESNPPVVRWCQLQQNLKLGGEVDDPFKAYVLNKETGKRPRKLDPDKAVWRDSHALFGQAIGSDEQRAHRPRVFDHLAAVEAGRRAGHLRARPVYAFGVFGLATVPGRASVELWRQERLPLPLAYLTSERLTETLAAALALAEATAKTLRGALRQLAKLLLSPQADTKGGRQPLDADVVRLAEHFGTDSMFWSRLETAFVHLLHDLPERLPPDASGFVGELRDEWVTTLRRIAREAFEAAVAGLDGSGRALKAAVLARGGFESALRTRLDPAA